MTACARRHFFALPGLSVLAIAAAVWTPSGHAAGAVQVGASGQSYASAGLACGLHPVAGMAPMVVAGLAQPAAQPKAAVFVNRTRVATLRAAAPEATVWLPPAVDTVAVAVGPGARDKYVFDATPTFPGQPNVCIPDTRANAVAGDWEDAVSGKSSATVVPGCAYNPQTGLTQPYVLLFDNGAYLLNVDVNNQPLTQLSAARPRAVVYLAPGLNVITATNGQLSVDAYVRDGGTGVCTLP